MTFSIFELENFELNKYIYHKELQLNKIQPQWAKRTVDPVNFDGEYWSERSDYQTIQESYIVFKFNK